MPITPFSLGKKHKEIPFKDYYTNWFDTLNNSVLPLLRQSLSSNSTSPILLSSHLYLLLHHFISYYDSLDLAATSNPTYLPHLLHPSWRNPLETPFLFLGDLHPYTFTNLLRSFIHKENNREEDEISDKDDENPVFDRCWQLAWAWKEPSERLMGKIEQIERGVRLMVPSLMHRVKEAQRGLVGRVAEDWVRKKEALEVGKAMEAEMGELVSIFLDANRLRRNVISEIFGALNLYQRALFLEALAEFLVGFKDPELLREFKKSKTLLTG